MSLPIRKAMFISSPSFRRIGCSATQEDAARQEWRNERASSFLRDLVEAEVGAGLHNCDYWKEQWECESGRCEDLRCKRRVERCFSAYDFCLARRRLL